MRLKVAWKVCTSLSSLAHAPPSQLLSGDSRFKESQSTPIPWEPARRPSPPEDFPWPECGHASTRNAHFSSCFLLPTSLSCLHDESLSSGVGLEAHEFTAPELVLLVHVTLSLRIYKPYLGFRIFDLAPIRYHIRKLLIALSSSLSLTMVGFWPAVVRTSDVFGTTQPKAQVFPTVLSFWWIVCGAINVVSD